MVGTQSTGSGLSTPPTQLFGNHIRPLLSTGRRKVPGGMSVATRPQGASLPSRARQDWGSGAAATLRGNSASSSTKGSLPPARTETNCQACKQQSH